MDTVIQRRDVAGIQTPDARKTSVGVRHGPDRISLTNHVGRQFADRRVARPVHHHTGLSDQIPETDRGCRAAAVNGARSAMIASALDQDRA